MGCVSSRWPEWARVEPCYYGHCQSASCTSIFLTITSSLENLSTRLEAETFTAVRAVRRMATPAALKAFGAKAVRCMLTEEIKLRNERKGSQKSLRCRWLGYAVYLDPCSSLSSDAFAHCSLPVRVENQLREFAPATQSHQNSRLEMNHMFEPTRINTPPVRGLVRVRGIRPTRTPLNVRMAPFYHDPRAPTRVQIFTLHQTSHRRRSRPRCPAKLPVNASAVNDRKSPRAPGSLLRFVDSNFIPLALLSAITIG